MKSKIIFNRKKGYRSFTLILTLIFVALLTMLVTSFFLLTLNQFRISKVYTDYGKNDFYRRYAVDKIVGELRAEIAIRSTNGGLGSSKIYFPVDQSDLLPHAETPSEGATVSFLRSSDLSPFPLSEPTFFSAGGVFEASSKRMGLKNSYWAKAGFEKEGAIPEPRWIWVGEDGLVSNLKRSTKNQNLARFSYAINEVGGLLDANLVGGPESTSAKRHPVMDADLDQIEKGLPAIFSKIANWRTPPALLSKYTGGNGSEDSSESYLRQYFSKNGYEIILKEGRTFLGREDFLLGAKSYFGIPSDVLPYFTVFSKDLNMTLYRPDLLVNAPFSKMVNFSFNEFRVSTPFKRRNGNWALVGEPILMDRFPLDPLSWITEIGPKSGISDTQIKSYFGLQWDNTNQDWKYVGSGSTASNNLETLAQIAQENREPNFFELLKATILDGSLGQYSGIAGSDTSPMDKITDIQIMRIGANFIDQFDADSYPTSLIFNGFSLYGSENLPYPSQMCLANWATFGEYPNPAPYYVSMLPQLWNPYQLNPHTSLSRPDSIQIVARSGGAWKLTQNWNWTLAAWATPSYSMFGYESFNATPIQIPQNSFATYREPALVEKMQSLKISQAVPSAPSDIKDKNGYTLTYNDNSSYTWNTVAPLYYAARLTNAVIVTRFLNPNGKWKDYSSFSGVTNVGYETTGIHPRGGTLNQLTRDAIVYRPYQSPASSSLTQTVQINSGFAKIDPRTDRFGLGQLTETWGLPIPLRTPLYSLRPQVGSDVLEYKVQRGFHFELTPWWSDRQYYGGYNNYNSGYLADMAENHYSSGGFPNVYPDRDGIVRWGDSGYDRDPSLGTLTVNPMQANVSTNRPIVLDRPARSSAEMGYAHRDMPWKTLDLFTTNSADAGLLENFTAYQEPRVVSGKINLNQAPAPILAALLSKTPRNEMVSGDAISSGEAQTIARDLKVVMDEGKTPFLSRQELVTKWENRVVNETYPAGKFRREAPIRALGDIANFRTWNFFIDLTVQTGVMPPGKKLAANFLVETSSHYWVSIALDRYTGKIIDLQVEYPE